MTTKRAPKTRARGRRLVLAGVFSVALVTIFAQAVPAVAAQPASSKSQGNAYGNTKAAPECTTSEGSGGENVDNSGKSDEPKSENGNNGNGQGNGNGGNNGNGQGNGNGGNNGNGNGQGNGSGAGGSQGGTGNESTSNGSSGNGSSKSSDETKDNGPCTGHVNKSGVGHDDHNGWGYGHDGTATRTVGPKDDKYNGPCTSHENTQGVGHDNHNGWGYGHDGTRTVCPGDDDGDDGDDDDGVKPSTEPTPSTNPTSTPKPNQNPVDDGPKKDPVTGEPYMPFVEPVSNKVIDKTTDDFLPFTGGELDYLLAVAACAALAGTKLRFASRRRYEARRRAR